MYLIRILFIFTSLFFVDLSAMFDYLEYLDFYVSEEEVLDDFFSFFPAIEILDLSNNRLSFFPDILCLKNLKELYLNNNPIEIRPSPGFMYSLINMENLKILSLIKNPLGKKLFWYYCKTFTAIDPTEDPDEVDNRLHRHEIEKKLIQIMIFDNMFTPAAESRICKLITKK